ncbi:MAG: proteasome assembly chaperone family protein, partial [bacterium]|nr:proteasome assembly chaperone family protein [bacterium]
MDKTLIREKKKVKLKNPVMVTGLPGIGLVG